MGSWFLGPRGENAEVLKDTLNSIVDYVKSGRLQFWPQDPVCYHKPTSHGIANHALKPSITAEMSTSQEFQDSVAQMQLSLGLLSEKLAQHSVPFYSARYAGHMNGDISSMCLIYCKGALS